MLEATPYTSNTIRIFPVMAVIALCSCATTAASSTELLELKAAVRALREENARLESRLQRVEDQRAVAQVAPAASTPSATATAVAAPAVTPPAAGADAVPSLTVVKLKPKKEAAPKVPTAVAIVEPSPEAVEALGDKEEPGPTPVSEDDATMGDALFERGVHALKTGNVMGGVEELQRFAGDSPRHAKADNALYFSGLGLMGLEDLRGAARAFEEVIARYPAGDAVVDAMLKLAECRARMNKPAEARGLYQRIVSTYPGTAAATQAQTRLSSLR